MAQINKAIQGDTTAAKEIADYTEGKARESDLAIGLSDQHAEFYLHVHLVDSDGVGHDNTITLSQPHDEYPMESGKGD